MTPVMRLCCTVINHFGQITVGNRQKLGWDCGDHLGCGTIIGSIVTGEPVAMITRLTKGPCLDGTCGVFGDGFDEVQTAAWLCIILNGNSEDLSMMLDAIPYDDQFFSICRIHQFLTIF